MKKLVAVMQKKEVSREEMINKLEEILIPLATIVNDSIAVYHGFPVESIMLKGNKESFMIGFNGTILAFIDLKQSQFSVFGSPKYDLTAEEHAVISQLWLELQKLQSNNTIEDLMEILASKLGDN